MSTKTEHSIPIRTSDLHSTTELVSREWVQDQRTTWLAITRTAIVDIVDMKCDLAGASSARSSCMSSTS